MNDLSILSSYNDQFEPPEYYDDEEEAQYPTVYCSACGEGFGPGNEGFSDCKQHADSEQTT